MQLKGYLRTAHLEEKKNDYIKKNKSQKVTMGSGGGLIQIYASVLRHASRVKPYIQIQLRPEVGQYFWNSQSIKFITISKGDYGQMCIDMKAIFFLDCYQFEV